MVHDYIVDLVPVYNKEEASQLVFWLTEAFFNVSRTRLALYPDQRLTESEMLKLHFAVKELKKHTPVQYIIGEVSFLNIVLKVTPAVLIPRPETEELVDWVLKKETSQNLHILDIGTGSGCIALSIKNELPHSRVRGYDQSEAALAIARENALLNDLDVNFFKADMFQEQIVGLESMDVIISNPPYVLDTEKTLMKPNVLEYEPHIALFVTNDAPLMCYEAILKQARLLLNSGGRIYFEINESMGEEMVKLMLTYGYRDVQLKSDLNNKPRFLMGVKQ
ncbi:MAG: peptide chain release factor N(5)-glutamine methyltransferase [Bacteroidales bacterium]|nr:peptide chain release factor N(5)-glutamine methyltransferase [Bacteroidales bacterium]